MRFVNNGEPVKVRHGKITGYCWSTLKKGQVIELEQVRGYALGLKPLVTEGQIGKVKVETKQIEVPEKVVLSVPEKGNQNDFLKELCSINGIGKKTAKDIMKIFPESEDLKTKIRQCKTQEELPFRDDVSYKLWRAYGKKKTNGYE